MHCTVADNNVEFLAELQDQCGCLRYDCLNWASSQGKETATKSVSAYSYMTMASREYWESLYVDHGERANYYTKQILLAIAIIVPLTTYTNIHVAQTSPVGTPFSQILLAIAIIVPLTTYANIHVAQTSPVGDCSMSKLCRHTQTLFRHMPRPVCCDLILHR